MMCTHISMYCISVYNKRINNIIYQDIIYNITETLELGQAQIPSNLGIKYPVGHTLTSACISWPSAGPPGPGP